MKTAQELAGEFLKKGDALGWFEVLYKNAGGDPSAIPWADLKANPNLVEWLDRKGAPGRKGLVVGCGLGDDAEALAARGLDVTAFDISPTAIEWCKKRFPSSKVSYQTADLFRANFSADFVFESYTLQSLPVLQRRKAMDCIARFTTGTLLVLTRGREPSEDPGKLPWPMTRQELDHFKELGLKEVAFEDYLDKNIRRFRVEYQRPKA